MIENLVHDSSSITSALEPSQRDLDLMSTTLFQKFIDEIVMISTLVSDLPGGWDDLSDVRGFYKDGSLSSAANNIISNVVHNIMGNEQNLCGKPGTCWFVFQEVLKNNQSKCSLDFGELNVGESGVVFVSDFMVKHAEVMKEMDLFVQEIVDYCFINEPPFNLNEEIFKTSDLHCVSREEFWTIGSESKISEAIVDCWAFLLNENERKADHNPKKFFLGSSLNENDRKICRACICASLILSDMNKVRSQLLDNVIAFKDKRSKTLQTIEENRRKKARKAKKMKKPEAKKQKIVAAKKKK
uniref:Uncharacterized protein n=1 Tax=Chenopodium quinoa TaxID=63459 RepID=A0A803LLX6_CHEQI